MPKEKVNTIAGDFDVERREKFRQVYKQAMEHEKSTFEFEGNGFLTSFAGYLIEFLDSELGPRDISLN